MISVGVVCKTLLPEPVLGTDIKSFVALVATAERLASPVIFADTVSKELVVTDCEFTVVVVSEVEFIVPAIIFVALTLTVETVLPTARLLFIIALFTVISLMKIKFSTVRSPLTVKLSTSTSTSPSTVRKGYGKSVRVTGGIYTSFTQIVC